MRKIAIPIVLLVAGLALTGCSSTTTSSASAPAKSAAAATKKAAVKPAAVSWYASNYGTFTPITKTGTGASVLSLPAGAKAGIVTASYSGTENFIVQGLDKANQPTIDGLVNTIGTYKGTSAFGLDALGNTTTSLQVTATGAWSITISPISTAPALPAAGTGDGVYKYDGGAKTWAMTSTGTGNFIVTQYSKSAAGPNSAANAIGAYSGSVPADAGPSIVAITSSGNWTIK